MEKLYLGITKKQKRLLFLQCFFGWKVWHKIIKKYNMKAAQYQKTAVILMPQNDYENSYYALLYLDRMLSLKKYSSAILLYTDALLKKAADFMCDKIRGFECITEKEANALLQYYALYPFDERFIAASLTEPNGRNGKDLLNVNGITIEELVAIGIYQIVPYVQKKRPQYNGKDLELEKFMNIASEYLGNTTQRKIR